MHPNLYLILFALLLTACASIPTQDESSRKATFLLDANLADTAIAEIDQHEQPDNRLRLLRAEASTQKHDLADAARCYEAIVADTATSPGMRDLALRNLAAVLLQDNKPTKAYARLLQVSEGASKTPEVQRDLGVAAVANGQLDLAAQHFQALTKAEREKVEAALGRDFFARR